MKQGCPLSPTLFGLFVDGLHRFLLQRCPADGPQLHGGQRVPDLGYADDFVLMATTPAGLQRLINASAEFCAAVGMVISAEKTRVVVFSDAFPGPLRWHCNGHTLAWLRAFQYLGLTYGEDGGVHHTFKALHKKMWVAWALLKRQYGKLQCSTSVGLLLHLYGVCVPPTASYGCEVWALRRVPAGEVRKSRDKLPTSHLQILKDIAGVRTAVPTAVLLKELGVQPLHEMWWQRVVKFWNHLVDLPACSLHKQIALDDCRDAVRYDVQNWAWSLMRGLLDMGYQFNLRYDTMEPISVKRVLELLRAEASDLWQGIDVCPRTCPSAHAQLCTYERWFARPVGMRRPRALLEQPLTARSMRCLLRFRMGCHGLANDTGRRTGVPRLQRLCPHCDMHSIGDERHVVFECAALQPVRDKFPILFGDNIVTMKDFMWQENTVLVGKFIVQCFKYMRGDDEGGSGPSNQP